MGDSRLFRRITTALLAALLVVSAPVMASSAASAEELAPNERVDTQTEQEQNQEEPAEQPVEDEAPEAVEDEEPAAEETAPNTKEPETGQESEPAQQSDEAGVQSEQSIDGGTLVWGISVPWRNYITGNIAKGEFLAVEPATLNADNSVTWVNGAGEVDLEAGTGVFEYEGGLIGRGHPGHGGHEWALNQTLSNMRVELTSTTTATLSAEVEQPLTEYAPEYNGERVEMVDLTFEDGDLLDGQVVASGVFTEDGADIYSRMNEDFQPGAPVEDVLFGIGEEAPDPREPTKTELSASTTTVYEDEEVVLEAEIDPAIEGDVTFLNGGDEIGEPVAVANGTATLKTEDLGVGEHSITAQFQPADDGYAPSTSSAVSIAVIERSGGGGSVEGSMQWGVKESFRSYVVGNIASGKITPSKGAKQGSGNGVFTFPQAASGTSWNGRTGTVQYAGQVNFYGHSGVMDVTLANPKIRVVDDNKAEMRIPLNGKETVFAEINLGAGAKQELDDDAVRFNSAPVTLTRAGAQFFAYQGDTFYQAGETLDRITFTIGEASDIDVSEPPPTKPAPRPKQERETKPASTGGGSGAGSLRWGVSEFFVGYTTQKSGSSGCPTPGGHCAGGSIQTSGVGSGWLFPQTAGTDWNKETQTGTVKYSGVVSFRGYGLTMFQVANPSITVQSDTRATLSTGYSGNYGPSQVELDLGAATKTEGADGEVTWSDVPVLGGLRGISAGQNANFDSLSFTVGEASGVTYGSTDAGDGEDDDEKRKAAANRTPVTLSANPQAQTVADEPVAASVLSPSGMGLWEWWMSAGGLVLIAACTTLLAVRQSRAAALPPPTHIG